MNSPCELVELLSSGQLRVATGLWLMPLVYIGHEVDEALRLNLEPVDLRDRLLEIVEPGSKYSGLDVDRIIQLVDKVSQELSDSAGALIFNFDLLLSRLNAEQQQNFWNDVFNALPHRRRGVLLTLPETAQNLLPPESDLNLWLQENRLVGTIRDII